MHDGLHKAMELMRWRGLDGLQWRSRTLEEVDGAGSLAAL